MNRIGIEHVDSRDDSKSKGKENPSSTVKKFGSEFGNVNTAKAYLSLPVADSNSAKYRDIERNRMKNVMVAGHFVQVETSSFNLPELNSSKQQASFTSRLTKHLIWYPVLISNGKFLILSNGKFDLAREIFDKMAERDLFSWNVMFSGYVRNKNLTDARKLFDRSLEGMLFLGMQYCLGTHKMDLLLKQDKFLMKWQ